jgi:hypothetical protein
MEQAGGALFGGFAAAVVVGGGLDGGMARELGHGADVGAGVSAANLSYVRYRALSSPKAQFRMILQPCSLQAGPSWEIPVR